MQDMARLLVLSGLVLMVLEAAGCGPEPDIDGDMTAVVDATAVGDDDGSGDDDASIGDDDSPGNDDLTPGDDDDASAGDDDTVPGDDDASDADSPTPYAFEDCSEQTRSFWAGSSEVMSTSSVSVASTCRFAGPTTSVYVADDQWEVSVTAEQVEAFLSSLEFRAPSGALYPQDGIMGNEREVFGIPPDVDGDGRLFVLLLDIPDVTGSDGVVYSFDGYFNPDDQLTDQAVLLSSQGKFHSNEAEVLYLNARLQPVTSSAALSATSRELQQLIHYNYDTNEEIWMNEALGYAGARVNGLYTDMEAVAGYEAEPSIPLVTRQKGGSAGAYVLWGMYLYEQLGANFMLTLEDEAQDGINGLNRALDTAALGTEFATLFADWIVANVVNDLSIGEGQFGYTFADALPAPTPVKRFSGPGGSYSGAVSAYGVDYVALTSINSNSTLSVTTSDYNALVTRLVQMSSDGTAATVVSSLRLTPQGELTASLEGGYQWSYWLVVSNSNTTQVDTGESLDYTLVVE